ncbi:MAG: type I restriction enzyme HsdR N-terminal domain-containing protein [Duncaniella sp.]|nr:type I restriction enzyme HsdR N-terminal domain-containing protein [Duncaniella sp.]
MQLNLPDTHLRLRRSPDSAAEVYDPLRKKWIRLTPEEWVRQHFTAYLNSVKGVPVSRMTNETTISLNGTVKRCDTVIYAHDLSPIAIVEYKAPSVAITRKVFDQIARYNLVLGTRYLIISNGLSHYCVGNGRLLPDIPPYSDMIADL